MRLYLPVLLFFSAYAAASNTVPDLVGFTDGHVKYFFLVNDFPDDSLFSDFIDAPSIDRNGDLRLKFNWHIDKISIATDYQMVAQHGDRITLLDNLPNNPIIPDAVLGDDNRLFDFTRVISESSHSVLTHRLDRLTVDYADGNAVLRFGRQAVSWGNGLIYNPLDFFNPFDPATVDKEYKTGDDMLYGQYLLESGDDLQVVWVIRRDNNGDVNSGVDSVAAKYHGFAESIEYDLLFAEHYDDTVAGIGGIVDISDAIWRGDITVTRTRNTLSKADNIISLVTSMSYSWTGWGYNTSGVIEYFYNGFGQKDANYSPAALAANPDLTERLIRGELFTLGRHYVAASAMVEITPLWRLTPNVFVNVSDRSFLAQLVSSYDLKQNWQLLSAINLPVGADGTEYGGIDSGIPGKPLSSGLSLFAQLAWYF